MTQRLSLIHISREIEKRSFEIISRELGDRVFEKDQEMIIKRCIHTSADFDYADHLCFSEHAVKKAMDAIKKGACIVTDTQMAKAGDVYKRQSVCSSGIRKYCMGM